MVKSTYPVIVRTCASSNPVVNNAACNADLVIELSQVQEILFVEPSATNPLVAAAVPSAMTAAAWSTVIDNAAVNGKIRRLKCVGEKPAPERKTAPVNGSDVTVAKDFSLNCTNNHVSIANYTAMKVLDGGTYFIWYITQGGYIYGGTTGILCQMTTDYVLTNGSDDIATMNINVKWRSLDEPPRELSPI